MLFNATSAPGLDEFQGDHFAPPMPVDDWLNLLRRSGGDGPTLPMLRGPGWSLRRRAPALRHRGPPRRVLS